MKQLLMLSGLLGAIGLTTGCIAAAVAGGAVVVDEIIETDGEFDPLEEAYDGDDETTPIIDEG
ncbi:MAG: hypothetical protein AAGC77_01465 [Pseudomonadota bacterium]